MSAEEIRRYVKDRYAEAARSRGQKEMTLRAGDIHDELEYRNLQPLVCDTLRGERLQELCNMELTGEQWGKHVHQRHAKNIWYTYRLL